ncbi:hypothetical protein FPOA_00094 [Fusarium poae]|uniref:Uncharacterized protein n=1 Tax=Fusarium poae TaxID=36050 RepID=A0A1B8B0D9_FUSPO|nr:hypothetical protein FPOA_00094 [Fusarium poae]
MEPYSRQELTRLAAEDIAVIIGKIEAESDWTKYLWNQAKIKNLMTLSASLLALSFNQAKYEQGEQKDSYLAKQNMLLDALELMCTYPRRNLSHTSPIPFPTLNSLVSANLITDNPSAADRELINGVKESIISFVSGPKNITGNFFRLLRSFSDTRKQARRQAESIRRCAGIQQAHGGTKTIQPVEDETYPKHVYDTLYRTLQKHAKCRCILPGQSPSALGSHLGRLELKGNIPTMEDDFLFHTVFSKQGLLQVFDNLQWQHLQFIVPRNPPGRKMVHFEVNPIVKKATKSTCNTVRSTSEFCELLTKNIGPAAMHVRISDGALQVLETVGDIEVDIAHERSIPLSQVLRDYTVVSKGKILIAYILAKSIWQFYDSEFMSVRWTTENIQLFQKEQGDGDEDDESSIHWAPYYTFSFEHPAEPGSMERLPRDGVLHRYPRVLALGAILYELGLPRGKKSKVSTERSDESPTLEGKINMVTNRVRKGVTGENWPDIGLRDTQTRANYRVIVENCASKDLFRPSGQDPDALEEELTIDKRRTILFEAVVEPLKRIAQDCDWVDDKGNIRSGHARKAFARLMKEYPTSQDLGSSALLNDTTQVSRATYLTQGVSGASSNESQAWLNKIKTASVMDSVVSAFAKGELKDKRIHIAVLDTGYDPGAVFFANKDRLRRLRKSKDNYNWKDFVEKGGQDKPKDEQGHGTHVLSVLMNVAPAADIFVARVARNNLDLQDSARNVAEAIEWAWKECSADIVTMSFGFDGEQYVDGEPIVGNAILKALTETSQRTLFFSAAANEGGNRNEMFPASNQNVMSIRGSDDRGWACSFNPPPDYNAETCFMTLGVDVPGASLAGSKYKGGEVLKSGTSVATPIAAGIAAMLLGYAKIHEQALKRVLGPRDEVKLQKIRRIAGMSKLFGNMSTEMMEKWSYLNIDKFTDCTDDLRLSMIANAVREAKD